MDKLRPKQERFCLEYVKDLNGTQAAIRAGYAANSANEQSARMLAKDSIKSRVEELKAKQLKRLEFDADTVLRELLALATADVTQAYDDMGKLKPLSEIPENVRKAIAHLEVVELFDGSGDQKHAYGLASKVRFHGKDKPLELLGKHLALFVDRTVLTGKDGGPIQMEHKDVTQQSTDELKKRALELFAVLDAKDKPNA